MAVTRTRTMLSESFDNFVAPVINKPVPNHLLETSKYALKHESEVYLFLKQVLLLIFVVMFCKYFVFVFRNLCQSWAECNSSSKTIRCSLFWVPCWQQNYPNSCTFCICLLNFMCIFFVMYKREPSYISVLVLML